MRGAQAVALIAASSARPRARAWRCGAARSRTSPARVFRTSSLPAGSASPAARWAAPTAARRTFRVLALQSSAIAARCAATVSAAAGAGE